MLSEGEFTQVFLGYGFVRVNGDGREVKRAPRDEPLRRFDYPPEAKKQGVLAQLIWSAAVPGGSLSGHGHSQMYPNLVYMHPNMQYGRGMDEKEFKALRRFTPHSVEELRERIEVTLRMRFDLGLDEIAKWWGTAWERPELKTVPRELMEMARSPYADERQSAMRVLADWLLDRGIAF